jgi:ATP-binding cassette subfamily F protein 3
VESPDITKFSGGIDDYFEQKEMIREQIFKQNLSAQAKKAKIMDFVNRFRAKNTKAKQAQSKLKSLDKIQTLDVKPLPISAKIQIPKPVHTGKQVLDMKNIDLGYGDKRILEKVTLQLNRGDHLGIVGINGAGKSTLLKGLAGILKPQNGEISWGYGVKISYFAQHTADQLDSDDRIYDALISEAHPDILPEHVLSLAGALLFSKDDTEKKVKFLSGGEKTRVALGKILLKKSPFLILDEPTNHLDFATVEALAQSLSNYEGSVIIVSHDRAFIDRVATKILQIKDGQVELYPGNYQEYLWSVQNGVLSNPTDTGNDVKNLKTKKNPSSTSHSEKPKIDVKKERKRLKQEIQDIGKKISDNERPQQKNQDDLVSIVDKLNSASGNEATQLSIQCDELNRNIRKLEESWIELSSRKEDLESKLAEITFD